MPTQTMPTPTSMPRKRTIVAVDDDEMNLMIIMKNAQDAGYEVVTFMEAAEAIDYMGQNPDKVDIAIVDKMMPDISGIKILEFIHSHEALKYVPVVMQTGDAGVAQMCEALESGACYYLTKPFNPEMMAAVLRSANRICAMREELQAYKTGMAGSL
jgi:DNA-binding response OmpR family regulator